MAIPRTYLMMAPEGEPDTVGRGIPFRTIVSGLKHLNSRVNVWEQYPDGMWYPGKATGKTCLWLGEPGGASLKITSIVPGIVPEFTQIDPFGKVIMKGWRMIFEKCIIAKVATREAIEAHFNVNLTLAGEDYLCKRCGLAGQRRKHNGGAMRLCNQHERIMRMVGQIISDRMEQNNLEKALNLEATNVHV